MKNALTTIQISIRSVGTVLLILGLAFWAGLSPTLIVIHMVLGAVLVLLLLGLAYLGVRARVLAGLIIIDIVWSVVLPVLGMTQAQILPDWSGHWLVKIVHLLIGIGALAQAEMLGGRIKTALEASKVSKHPTRRVRVSN